MKKRSQARAVPAKPKVETTGDLLARTGRLCGGSVRTVEEALSALAGHVDAASVFPVKAISLAAKLARGEADAANAWAGGAVQRLLAAAESAEDWFAKPRAGEFLFAMNIAAGTVAEGQLRIIGDYALAKYAPRSETELIDQLRIASVFAQNAGDSYPHGAVFVAKRGVFEKDSFAFRVQQSTVSSAAGIFEMLMKERSVRNVSPELLLGCSGGAQAQRIIQDANTAKQSRIEEYMNRRVYPPMIQMIQPQISKVYKKKTEEERLKEELKRERAKTKKELRQTREFARQEKEKERIQKKIDKDKQRRQVMAMLEAGRTDDLNMAAAPAHEEEEEVEEETNYDAKNEHSNNKMKENAFGDVVESSSSDDDDE